MKEEYGEDYEAIYKLEAAHDQTEMKWATTYMRRRIQLVANACIGCSETDIYIAAGLAQNGPGFTKFNLDDWLLVEKNRIDREGVTLDWFYYFEHAHDNADDTSVQLNRFTLVINELINRGWYVPNVIWDTVTKLRKTGD